MAHPNRQVLSVEEYLWEEQRAAVKHDYYNGQVYNMAGSSPEHSRIAVNLTSELRAELRGGPCQTFNSDLKVAVVGPLRATVKKRQPTAKFINYPDASVVCGKLEFYKDDRQTIANPVVLFEVYNSATQNYDRGTKIEQYPKIPSLQSYVMISSEEIWIEQYFRTGLDSWQVDAPLEGLTENLEIKALGITIAVASLYEGLELGVEDTEGE